MLDKKHAIEKEAEIRKHTAHPDHPDMSKYPHDVSLPVYDEKTGEAHMEKLVEQKTHAHKDVDVPVYDSKTGEAHLEHVHYDK